MTIIIEERGDTDVVMEAVRQHRWAVKYASEKLQSDSSKNNDNNHRRAGRCGSTRRAPAESGGEPLSLLCLLLNMIICVYIYIYIL